MNISSLNFVMQQFESAGYRYFGIYDDEGMLVTYQNDVIDKSQALQKFRTFVRENTGFYTVMIFKSKLSNINNLVSRDKALEAKYNIQIEGAGQSQGIAGMTGQYQPSALPGSAGLNSGMGAYGGVSSLLPQDDPRNGAPNLWDMQKENANFRTEMLLMQKDHNHYRELKERDDMIARLQEENKSAKGIGAVTSKLSEQLLDPAVIAGLISGFRQVFSPQPQEPRPINGMGDTATQYYSGTSSGNVIIENGSGVVESLGATRTETMQSMEAKPKDPKMQAIENAVRELIKSDPDFHKNIAKLAQIAQKSPGIYKMAVQYLSTL
jgi:hypothetical protein